MSALVQNGIHAGGKVLRLCLVIMFVIALIAMTLLWSFVVYRYLFTSLLGVASTILAAAIGGVG